MVWFVARHGLIAICLALASFSCVAFAQAPKAKPKDGVPDSLYEKLEELETLQKELSQLADFGTVEVRSYWEEIAHKYKRLENQVAEAASSEHVAVIRQQQNLLSLYLWQIKQLAPLAVGKGVSTKSLQDEVRKLLAENRSDLIKDPQLMARISNLQRNANPFARSMSYQNRSFCFVRPGKNFLVGAAVSDDKVAGLGGADHRFETDTDDLDTAMQRVLKVAYVEGGLALDRSHWDAPFKLGSLAAVHDEVVDQLKMRGIELDQQKMRFGGVNRGKQYSSSAALLFENFHHAALDGARGSATSSTTTGGFNLSFRSGRMDASMAVSGENVNLDVSRYKGPEHVLRVQSHSAEHLRIVTLDKDLIFVLTQNESGRFNWSSIDGEQAISKSADSFADFYAKYPETVEEAIFPLLERQGFILPPTRFDSKFIDRAIEFLNEASPETNTRFAELFADLGSKRYVKRQQATIELKDNLNTYLPLVLAESEKDEQPLEVKNRLREVLEAYKPEWREVDSLVLKMKLGSDVAYWIDVLRSLTAEQQEKVVSHLSNETQQDFGTDVESWEQWLAEKLEPGTRIE